MRTKDRSASNAQQPTPRATDAPARELPLSPSRAFVIQLREGVEVGKRFAGRAEHVQSAHAAQFQSLEELLAFIQQVLSDLKKSK